MRNPNLACSALEATIRKVRGDFYSPIPETKRLADAMKERMVDALLILAGADDKELQLLASEVFRRFCDGPTDGAVPQTHEAETVHEGVHTS